MPLGYSIHNVNYYTWKSRKAQEELQVQGSGFKVQGSVLTPGAARPLITYEIGSAGSTGSEGSTGVVRRIKIWKRRGV